MTPPYADDHLTVYCGDVATVLDHFAGTGTVGLVANRLGRRAVLIDLSTEYMGQLLDRNRQAPLGLGAA